MEELANLLNATGPKLARELGPNPATVHRVLRHLVDSGLVIRAKQGNWATYEATDALRDRIERRIEHGPTPSRSGYRRRKRDVRRSWRRR